MTDKVDLKLGSIIKPNEDVERDAIHIAVAPVTAAFKLMPGDHVGFVGADRVGITAHPIGIVDPFMRGFVEPNDRFWLFLYPNTITTLRHHWVHPDFDREVADAPSKAIGSSTAMAKFLESQLWLKNFAENAGLSYKRLLELAKDWVDNDEYAHGGNQFEGVYTGDDFWVHYEIVTDTKVPPSKKHSFFSCSC